MSLEVLALTLGSVVGSKFHTNDVDKNISPGHEQTQIKLINI